MVELGQCRLCVGCGACSSVCPEQRIELVDVENEGIRPILLRGWEAGRLGSRDAGRSENCEDCRLCLEVCPGMTVTANDERAVWEGIPRLRKRWGTVLEVWEGHASDPEVRFKGSSGGLCTALSLFCLESGIAGGVHHIGSDPEAPWKNKTFRSTTKKELVSRTGSRYSPASPCDSLKSIEDASDKSVFIGKPCDVAGLRMAQRMRAELERKTALAIGFFCAGTPSTQGTLDLLRKHGVEPERIANLRYRGMGWPGMATAQLKDNGSEALKLSYQDSWGFVQKYRPFRCYLCPDLTAESADISVGDPWYRDLGVNDPGRSLVLIRTERGREIFQKAIDKGYVTAEKAVPEIIYRSQKSLLGKRQAIWGRLLAMKMLGIPRPELEGFHLFENWLDLPAKEKARSILGTARRIIQRNYFKPMEYKR